MAKQVLTNAFVSIDGNDVSSFVQSVTLSYEAELQDDTTMGDDTRTNIGGLKNWSMDVQLVQDFAAASIDSILFPLVGTSFTVIVRPDAGVVSTSNPQYSGTGVLGSYSPLGNSVGDLAVAPITISPAGTLARTTA